MSTSQEEKQKNTYYMSYWLCHEHTELYRKYDDLIWDEKKKDYVGTGPIPENPCYKIYDPVDDNLKGDCRCPCIGYVEFDEYDNIIDDNLSYKILDFLLLDACDGVVVDDDWNQIEENGAVST